MNNVFDHNQPPRAGIARLALEQLFPQFAVNRLFESPLKQMTTRTGEVLLRRPFRWVINPITSEMAEWLSARAGNYFLHWLFAFVFVSVAGAWIGPPYGALLMLLWTALAGWTLFGMGMAVGIARKARKERDSA